MRKISFLENLERNLEGFSKSVKTVVNAQSHGKVHGICGPVSRVISVPKEYGVAIETALGSAMQNIVTEPMRMQSGQLDILNPLMAVVQHFFRLTQSSRENSVKTVLKIATDL